MGGPASHRRAARQRVGVLELLSLPSSSAFKALENFTVTKQFASLTPQAISVWCRSQGHDVTYATYYGNGAPEKLMPSDLDVVFIATATMMSPLAYALAKVFRRQGARCVVGGPHSKSFPDDCQRYFDIVVLDCDESLIEDIVAGRVAPGSVVSSGRAYQDTPLVEERLPEIGKSAFLAGRPYPGSFIPMLTSMGCPYTCNFCVDWNNSYRPLSVDRLAEDLRFVSENLPRATLGILDPNFGVRFDEVLDVFSCIEPDARVPYIVESSLSILKFERMQRLAETRCAAISPGIESWTEYSNKAGVGSKTGYEKMRQVVTHLHELQRHVPYVGVNFIFGLDGDRGSEPFQITQEFLQLAPFVWPSVNVPFAFGGTPFYQDALAEGRMLKPLPFNFYTMPYLTLVPKHYDPLVLLEHVIDIYRTIASWSLYRKRTAAVDFWVGKASFTMHTLIARHRLRTFEATRARLLADEELLAFHRGEVDRLPAYYGALYRQQLGRYASIMADEDPRPLLSRSAVDSTAPRIPVRELEPQAASSA